MSLIANILASYVSGRVIDSNIATPYPLVVTILIGLVCFPFLNSTLMPLGPSLKDPWTLSFVLIAIFKENPFNLKARS